MMMRDVLGYFTYKYNGDGAKILEAIERNHVGIVVEWDGVNITVQESNLDGETNTFEEAKSYWRTVTYDIDRECKIVIYSKNIY